MAKTSAYGILSQFPVMVFPIIPFCIHNGVDTSLCVVVVNAVDIVPVYFVVFGGNVEYVIQQCGFVGVAYGNGHGIVPFFSLVGIVKYLLHVIHGGLAMGIFVKQFFGQCFVAT